MSSRVLTVADVRRAVAKAGGTLEKDERCRDMRTLQAVAPFGMVWSCDMIRELVILWATGNSPHAAAHRADTLRDLQQRLDCGLETDQDELDLGDSK